MDCGKLAAYVDECYRKKTFLLTYQHLINAVPSEEEWLVTNYDPIIPLVIRKKPGKP
jgi:hypothetical protein